MFLYLVYLLGYFQKIVNGCGSVVTTAVFNPGPFRVHCQVLQKADDQGYDDRSQGQGHDYSSEEKVSDPIIRH